MKEYKMSFLRIVIQMFLSIFFAGIVYFVAEFFSEMHSTPRPLLVYAITGLAGFLYVYLMIWNKRIYVRVDEHTLYIKENGKEYHFTLNEVSASAYTSNHEATLYIHTDTEKHDFDLDLLSASAFGDLLEDLGVVGEKQTVLHLETKK